MAEFPELKLALLAWVNDGVQQLALEQGEEEYAIDPGHWRRDSDGIFRNRDRTVAVWDNMAVDKLFELPIWTTVLDVLHSDDRLNDQIDTLVGTVQGAIRIEAKSIGRRVLPRPDELDRLNETFETRYQELERFLAADEIEYTVVWPLPGLTSDSLPVHLEDNLELDAMSDRELGFAFDAEIVRPIFPRQRLLDPQSENRTCVRYRYSLPKLLGDRDTNAALGAAQEIEDKLQWIEPALKESLAIVLPDAVGVAGRFGIMSHPGHPQSEGMTFQQATLAHGARLRRSHMTRELATELSEIWQLLRQPGLLERNKGLALCLRRLSYQAQRAQSEDELLDTMIAAEALYLQDMGDASERGELRYRLALRAALWSDSEGIRFTKREVLGVMRSAYDARSAIAHGGALRPGLMRVRGQRVPLSELATAAKAIITTGAKAALTKAASGEGWPPDWDGLALGEVPEQLQEGPEDA